MSDIHVRYIVTCEDTKEYAINNIDFKGVFDGKKFPEIPAKFTFSIVISFEYFTTNNSAPAVMIRLLDPQKRVMAKELKIDLNIHENSHEQETIISVITIRLPNFPVKEEGFYIFQVLHEDDIIAEQAALFELEEEK